MGAARATTLVLALALMSGGVSACTLLFFDGSDYGGQTDDAASVVDAGDHDVRAEEVGGGADVTTSDVAADAIASSAYAKEVLVDAPIGYWRLGETSGAIALDRAGNTPGTYVGVKLAVAGTTADGDTAGDFTNSQVRLGQGFAFSGKKPFSCEAWILPRKIDDSYRRFLGRKILASPRQGYSFGVHAPQGVYFDRWIDDTAVDTSIVLPATSGFHHIVGTYDGAALRLYVDGSRAVGPLADARDMPEHTADELIGAALTTGEQAFDGIIDEVAIYAVALPANRVLAHFDAAKH